MQATAHTNENRRSYSADYESDGGRRRGYTLSLPGMGADPQPSDPHSYSANLQNDSYRGDNILSNTLSNNSMPSRSTRQRTQNSETPMS